MTDPKKNDDFNETLKRMLDAPPKPHEEMKKGRERTTPARNTHGDKKSHETE